MHAFFWIWKIQWVRGLQWKFLRMNFFLQDQKELHHQQNRCSSYWWYLVFRYTRFERKWIWKKRQYGKISVTFDIFSKYVWIVPVKKIAQITKDSFENILLPSKRAPIFFETVDRKEFVNKILTDFSKSRNTKRYSRNTTLGAVFTARPNRTIGDLLKKPVGDANWIDILPTITKQYNNRKHSSTKLTPTQASLKKNEVFVYQNLLHKRDKVKPQFQLNKFVRVANLKKTFSKRDTTNWSNQLYEFTESIKDATPSYRMNDFTMNLPERYNEALLKKSKLSMEEIEKKLKNFRQFKLGQSGAIHLGL